MGGNSEESAAEDDLAPFPDPDEGGHSSQKYACDRCRKRKTRCDRAIPCAQCAMVESPCSYSSRYKPREKRQRVMISARYEEKVDNLTRKLDELNAKIDCMSDASSQAASPFNPQQAASTADNSPQNIPSNTPREVKAEHEGESSFSAHALYATKFLQNVVNNNEYSEDVVQEMASIVDTLRDIIHAQKQQSDCLEDLYPHARPRPSGPSLRHLPMPPIDVALSLLWKAKETPRIRCCWMLEFLSVSQFTDYFLRVYSPTPATDADKIIVNGGLFWLFSECAEMQGDQKAKHDYKEHASTCRDNLETVLANLPFHTPITIDYVLAMSVATTYCRQMAKPSLAWFFIKAAALMCQSLGLHSAHSLYVESPESRRQKIHLFWVIYVTERMLSLRLGRSSSFRDQDITIPRLGILQDREPDSLLNPILPKWIEAAGLQGRTYDEIYSAGALIQPAHVRESRARALAGDLEKLLNREDAFEKQYNNLRREALGDAIHELMLHAERVSVLSLLTLIYRGIPPSKPSGAAFSNECIAAAREALHEHEKCIFIITSCTSEIPLSFLELYIVIVLLESPCLPFIVLFCHIIETSSSDDLSRLGSVVETLQSTSPSPFYRACSKQFRLFSALYHVARKYVEVKATQPQGWMNPIDFIASGSSSVPNLMAGPGHAPTSAPSNSLLATSGFPVVQSSQGDGIETSAPQAENLLVSGGVEPVNQGGGDASDNQQLASWTQAQMPMPMPQSMEMDPIGTELGNWFYENQQMLKCLDNGYHF